MSWAAWMQVFAQKVGDRLCFFPLCRGKLSGVGGFLRLSQIIVWQCPRVCSILHSHDIHVFELNAESAFLIYSLPQMKKEAPPLCQLLPDGANLTRKKVNSTTCWTGIAANFILPELKPSYFVNLYQYNVVMQNTVILCLECLAPKYLSDLNQLSRF